MQFLIIVYDGSDQGALERRMAARPAHIELGDRLRDAGHLLYGTAILDASGLYNKPAISLPVLSKEYGATVTL